MRAHTHERRGSDKKKTEGATQLIARFVARGGIKLCQTMASSSFERYLLVILVESLQDQALSRRTRGLSS